MAAMAVQDKKAMCANYTVFCMLIKMLDLLKSNLVVYPAIAT
jgi:hypothetical protein